jgi:1-acyl-sn-glycerol-3-phosphate acyltransferase
MIKPARYILTDWFWHWYFNHILSTDFHAFSFSPPIPVSPDKAVLLLGNHFSWWDGFISYRLNELHINKRLHIMMLEDQLKKNSFLRYAGAYSIQRKGRQMLESLHYTSGLLENPDNLVIVFPQGKIESMHTCPIRFEKGICKIIENCKQPVQILFSVTLTDYISHRKPALHIYLKEYDYEQSCTLEAIEIAFNEHLQEARRQQQYMYRS